MDMGRALRAVAARWPGLASPSTEEPVFVLGAGWRCGSTLLQRMLLRHCLVWGEPFGRAVPLDGLARQWAMLTEQWPPDRGFIDRRGVERLSEDWVANLYPPLPALLDAHLAYCATLLREPAARLGFARWGLKEVRLGADHGLFLRWLFPRAKFLWLYRDPYACYRSFAGLRTVFRRWPDDPIDSPEKFGAHWRDLAEDFVRRAVGAVGGVLLRYEELCAADFDPRPLEEYLGLELDLAARAVWVGGYPAAPPSAEEYRRLAAEVEPLAGQLGYRAPE